MTKNDVKQDRKGLMYKIEKTWAVLSDRIIMIFLPGVIILWYFFLMIQLIHSLINNDYSMYPLYIQVTLTLFGFTLLGSIFGNFENIHVLVSI